MALPTVTIDIIRHAEAQHNILGSHIRDPPLTAAGRAQSRELARGFPYSRQVARVVASPLRRTIETATVAFADSVLRAPSSPGRQKQQKQQQKKPKKILLLPELQEVNPVSNQIFRVKHSSLYIYIYVVTKGGGEYFLFFLTKSFLRLASKRDTYI